jgi:hypothetical protein
LLLQPRDAFPNGGAETVPLLHCPQSHVLHKMLGVHTGVSGDSGKLGFLLGGKTYFHAPNVGVLPSSVNSTGSLRGAGERCSPTGSFTPLPLGIFRFAAKAGGGKMQAAVTEDRAISNPSAGDGPKLD